MRVTGYKVILSSSLFIFNCILLYSSKNNAFKKVFYCIAQGEV